MNQDLSNAYKGNIYITGFMASGKSTFGTLIAQRLKLDFRDIDQMIIRKEGRTINELFAQEGETYFRAKEKQYLLETIQHFNGVVALGGGALHNQQVVDQLKEHGLLIFIETSIKEITERVFNSPERPILFKNGKRKTKQALFDELKTLYSKRQKFYEQAHIQITSKLFSSTEEMVEAAIKNINYV